MLPQPAGAEPGVGTGLPSAPLAAHAVVEDGVLVTSSAMEFIFKEYTQCFISFRSGDREMVFKEILKSVQKLEKLQTALQKSKGTKIETLK